MKFYHVTPIVNAASIIESGIDPTRSRGKLVSSWFVGKSRLVWAIAHVAAKYNLSPRDLVIFEINCQSYKMIHTSLRGVYRSTIKRFSSKTPQKATQFINYREDV